MRASYIGLLSGLAFSIVLVYLLIVVNFQSWLDPFIMISALPAALAGIAWFLFITHTTLSVPALMGAIMCMGVATSNSILVVSFATEKMTEGMRFHWCRTGSRIYAFSPRADDRFGHDHRHGARWLSDLATAVNKMLPLAGRSLVGCSSRRFRRCSLFRRFSAFCKAHAGMRAKRKSGSSHQR